MPQDILLGSSFPTGWATNMGTCTFRCLNDLLVLYRFRNEAIFYSSMQFSEQTHGHLEGSEVMSLLRVQIDVVFTQR